MSTIDTYSRNHCPECGDVVMYRTIDTRRGTITDSCMECDWFVVVADPTGLYANEDPNRAWKLAKQLDEEAFAAGIRDGLIEWA